MDPFSSDQYSNLLLLAKVNPCIIPISSSLKPISLFSILSSVHYVRLAVIPGPPTLKVRVYSSQFLLMATTGPPFLG